ncbi:MAG: hypothetical protein CMN32_14465 [Saprospirales bacterium]|nr:hypothetical protein [Saprospirales bacterium]
MSKNSMIFRTATKSLFAALFLLLLFSSACKKEQVIPDNTDESGTDTFVVEPADAQNDLIAFVDPLFAIVFVDPAYLNEVIEVLQASQNDAALIDVPVTTAEGVRLGIKKFELIFMPAQEIANVAVQAEESLTPDLVETFEKEGTRYRVFRNAKCGQVKNGFDGPCYPTSNNRSAKNTWYDHSNCVRGDSYCVEAFSIVGVKNTYDNADCNGPVIKIEPYYGWACK